MTTTTTTKPPLDERLRELIRKYKKKPEILRKGLKYFTYISKITDEELENYIEEQRKGDKTISGGLAQSVLYIREKEKGKLPKGSVNFDLPWGGSFLVFDKEGEGSGYIFSGSFSGSYDIFSGKGSGRGAKFSGFYSGFHAKFSGDDSGSDVEFLGPFSGNFVEFSGKGSGSNVKLTGYLSGLGADF